ncbi:glyoxalase [Pedobacter steynii]|uniref:Glyoxalase n=1 Tax=Pedobacter steynii TaxID=430522 RepID=A0A1D7QGJ8_9SPHI|nr:glyoxalase [Pedobacter steynii]AOM77812.1 glyoxalase [Pedobacter steynii]
MNTPRQHQAVMPYLMLEGAQKFTDFIKKVFDAEVTQQHQRVDQSGLLMHGEAQISGSTIMYCDAVGSWGVAVSNLFIYVDNADERFHKAIEAGATTVMELSDKEYGRTCGVKDTTGNVWWITSLKS